MAYKVNTTIQKGETGYMSFAQIPEDIVDQIVSKGNRRVICKVNEDFEFHCAIQKMKGDIFYIGMSKSTLKKGNLHLGQALTLLLRSDTTKYQSAMPEELEEVLKSDFEGNEKFQQLTPGKQRSIIYLVSSVKSTDKKIERALKVIENLKIGITNPREFLK